MRIIKKLLSLFVVLVILTVALSNLVTATDRTSTSSIDSVKQQLFQNQHDSIQSNTSISDKEKIEKLVSTFFTAKADNYKNDDGDIDVSIFFDYSTEGRINHIRINNLSKLEKGLRKGANAKISRDKLNITINEIDINNNSASVNVYENYRYTLEGVNQGESSRGITYNFDFMKKDGKWLISNITSDNEFDNILLSSVNYDVANVFKERLSTKIFHDSKAMEKEAELNKLINNSSTNFATQSLEYYTYHRDWAGTYARAYSNSSHSNSDPLPYNSLFPNYCPNDCQNFASQCIWYGFGGTNNSTYINNKEIPMVSSDDRAWYQSGTKYDNSNTWTAVINFANYISSSSYLTQGPMGVIYTNDLSCVDVGDTIQITNGTRYYHTYVVSAVTGTLGARTNSDIWVCAHTANRYNERFDIVWGSSQTNTRNIRILGAFY